MNDKAITIYNHYDELQKAALALFQSGFFKDVSSQAQAIVKVMAGAELGLPPFASMTGIHIIQGKPVLGANVIATLVKNDPRYDYKIKQCNGAVCELEWFENGKPVGSASFTLDEAKAAGLLGKDNWAKYPSDMLFARAISRGARRYAPGIFGGSPVYTPEEMGVDTDEDGHVIVDAVITEQPSNNGHEPKEETVPADVQKAMERVGNDKRRYGDLTDVELQEKKAGLAEKLSHLAGGSKGYESILVAIDDLDLIAKWRKEHPAG